MGKPSNCQRQSISQQEKISDKSVIMWYILTYLKKGIYQNKEPFVFKNLRDI